MNYRIDRIGSKPNRLQKFIRKYLFRVDYVLKFIYELDNDNVTKYFMYVNDEKIQLRRFSKLTFQQIAKQRLFFDYNIVLKKLTRIKFEKVLVIHERN